MVTNFLFLLAVGGLIGWAASWLMRPQEGVFLNVVVGIVGAGLGGWLSGPLGGPATINQNNFNLPSLVLSFLGAVMLLVVVNFMQQMRRI